MKVLCCGDRNWNHWPSIWRALRGLGPLTVIVHGDGRGADRMCGYVAAQLGYRVHAVPADWERDGRAAGPKRNEQMFVRHPDIDLVLAFHDHLSLSKGTRDTVWRARARGIPVNVVTSTVEA